MYRKNLGEKIFDEIGEYADDFISYIEKILNSYNESDDSLFSIISGHFFHIFRKIVSAISNNFDDDDFASAKHFDAIQDIISIEITRLVEFLEGVETNKNFTDIDQGNLLFKYRRQIFAARKLFIDDELGRFLNRDMKKKIWRLSFLLCIKNVSSINTSGIVLGGFGEKQIFPSLRAFRIDGLICGRLKVAPVQQADISHHNEAVVIPFAQSEMVHLFMEGVDKDHMEHYQSLYEAVISKLPDIFVGQYIKGKKRKEEIAEELKMAMKPIIEGIRKQLSDGREKNFVQPITQTVRSLPKEEMAMLAESLVQLTSLRRRVSMDLETVGEPIDVAVISKGDGFIWIKRKHYFDPKQNPRFIQNYGKR